MKRREAERPMGLREYACKMLGRPGVMAGCPRFFNEIWISACARLRRRVPKKLKFQKLDNGAKNIENLQISTS